MKTIYFIRHSIRDVSCQEDALAPLTEKGLALAEELVAFFKDKEITSIYTSPYKRTIDTVLPLAAALDLRLQQVDNLKEREIGAWVADFDTFAKKQWQDNTYRLENGESLAMVDARMMQSLADILQQTSDNEQVVVCGHGTALARLFYCMTQGVFAYHAWQQMSMPDVYKVQFNAQHDVQIFERCTEIST